MREGENGGKEAIIEKIAARQPILRSRTISLQQFRLPQSSSDIVLVRFGDCLESYTYGDAITTGSADKFGAVCAGDGRRRLRLFSRGAQ